MSQKSFWKLGIITSAAGQLFCAHALGSPEAIPDSSPLIPCGARISFALATGLDSAKAKSEDIFKGRLSEDVTVDGTICIPKNSAVSGHISKVTRLYPASLTLVFDQLTLPNGSSVPITATMDRAGRFKVSRNGQDVFFKSPTRSGCNMTLGALSPEFNEFSKSTTITGPKNTSLQLFSEDVFVLDLCEDVALR